VQRHKAEEDIAVAAASILARDEFVKGLAKLEKQFEMKLPKGAGTGGCGGEKICGRTRRGRTGENFQAAFPHGAARARFAGSRRRRSGGFRFDVTIGKIDKVKEGLRQNPGFANQVQPGWGTALHEAARSGRADIAELLLEHGSDINATELEGDTPLHTAVKWGGMRTW
jgi:hypothetical protein